MHTHTHAYTDTHRHTQTHTDTHAQTNSPVEVYVDLDPVISKFDWDWWGLYGNTGNTFNCFIMSFFMYEDNIVCAIYAIWFHLFRFFSKFEIAISKMF